MAGANRFDTSQQQNYVSSYVPLPFEQIAALGERTNQNFRAGQAAEAELGALGQAIKAAPMYETSRQNFINEYNNKTKALVDKYQGNYGDPNFQLDVKRLTNEFKSRPEIDAFTNTLKSYQDWESQVKNPDNAMNLDFTYQKDPTGQFRQLDVNKEGVYSPTFTKYEDYTKAAKDVVGTIKESGFTEETGLDLNNTRINNGETEVYNTKTHKYEGVSEGRVQKLGELLAGNYAQTVAGKHHLQSLLGENIDYNTLSQMAASGNEQAVKTKEVVDKEFANHIFKSNANQIGGKTSDTIDYHFEHDRKKAKDNDVDNFGRLITTNEQGNPEATDMGSVLSGLGLDKIMDNNGRAITSGPLNSKYIVTKVDGTTKTFDNSIDAHKFAGNTGSISQQHVESNKSLDQTALENAQILVKKSAELGLGKPIDGDYRKQLYNYALNVAKRRSTTSNLQPNTSDKLTEFFLGDNSNIHNMEVYQQGNEDSNAKLTAEQVASMAKNSKITGVDYYGNNQAGWKVAVTPKDDKGKPAGVDEALIAIPRDKKFEEETRPIWTISKGALEFAKTGKVNPQYKDVNYDKVQEYAKKNIGGSPVISGTSTEFDDQGNPIIRGSFTQVINGEPQMFGIEFNPKYAAPIITTLDKIQNQKTEELQTKGSLNQYVTKLQENVKPSNIQH